MRGTYLTLGVLILSVTVLYVALGGSVEFVKDYAPGLATEALGILLTLVLVQRILERRQEEDRARASRGGVRRSESPLRDLAELWAELIKASLPAAPARPPMTFEDLLSSEWTSAVDDSDLSRVRYAWSGETWAESAARTIARARRQISAILESYGVHLNTHLIEALDDLRDDELLTQIESLGEQLRVEREMHPDDLPTDAFTLERASRARPKMLRTLMKAIRLYNESGVGEMPISGLPKDFWTSERPVSFGIFTGKPE
jgi:hypothetical protein